MLKSEYINSTKNVFTTGHNGPIKAKDIQVFIEDGHPYIHWVGILEDENGTYEIDIPKMDVNISAIVEESEVVDGIHFPKITLSRNIYVVEDNVTFYVNCKKKKMSKKDIEKELGYKVEIKEDD